MLRGHSFTEETDLILAEWLVVLDLAAQSKVEWRERHEAKRLVSKKAALLFEKTSTRTSCSSDVAMMERDGYVIHFDTAGSQFVHEGSAVNTARVPGRWYDGIEYHGFAQETLETIGRHAGTPVCDGPTDSWHPTQTFANQFTTPEHSGKPLEETSWAFVGDVRDNMGNSDLISAVMVGVDTRLAAPKRLQVTDEVRAQTEAIAAGTGARITITDNTTEDVAGVDSLHTDVWFSLGEPKEPWVERIELLELYQVSAEMIAATGNPRAKLMHCPPAFRDRNTTVEEEIYQATRLDTLEATDEVFESGASIVFDQVKNRMHAIKVILVAVLASWASPP